MINHCGTVSLLATEFIYVYDVTWLWPDFSCQLAMMYESDTCALNLIWKKCEKNVLKKNVYSKQNSPEPAQNPPRTRPALKFVTVWVLKNERIIKALATSDAFQWRRLSVFFKMQYQCMIYIIVVIVIKYYYYYYYPRLFALIALFVLTHGGLTLSPFPCTPCPCTICIALFLCQGYCNICCCYCFCISKCCMCLLCLPIFTSLYYDERSL